MLFKKRLVGLVSFSVGLGMLLALILSHAVWAAIVSILLLAVGTWNLFFC